MRPDSSTLPGSTEAVVWDADAVRPRGDASSASRADGTTTKRCPHCDGEYDAALKFCPQDGAVLRGDAPADDMRGRVIAGRYSIVRELGVGGMGRVYLATHVRLGRRCALKVLKAGLLDDVQAIARFDREATNASRITHPHVATVYDFGDAGDGIVYLAMEFVDGAPLSALLQREPSLSPSRACAIVAQIADGLSAAHQLGIVHRDLKPDNIMVGTNRDGSDCIKIVDFGIAKGVMAESQEITATGIIVGTPAYMSPEQLAGDDMDVRSDLYSLGLISFQLLTGALPFPSGQDALLARLALPPRTLIDVRSDVAWPPELQQVVSRTLAIMPGNRYASVDDFSRDFRRAIDAWQPATAPVPGRVPAMHEASARAEGSYRRRASRLTAFGIPAVAMLGVALYFLASATAGDARLKQLETRKRMAPPAVAVSAGLAVAPTSPAHEVQDSVAGGLDDKGESAATHGLVAKRKSTSSEARVAKGTAASPPRVEAPSVPVPVPVATHDSVRRSLDRLRELTDPFSGTDASARQALAEMPALLAGMRVGTDSIEAQYYAIQAHLLLGEAAAACSTLRRIEPRALTHPFLANAIKAIRADSAFTCP